MEDGTEGAETGRVRRVRDAVRSASRLELIVELDLTDSEVTGDLDTLAELAASIAGSTSAGLGIALPQRLVFAGAFGLPDRVQPLPAEETGCGHVVAQRRPVLVRVASGARPTPADPDPAGLTAAEAHELELVAQASGAAVYDGHPVLVDGEVLGSLCVFDAAPLALDEHQQHLLALLARHASDHLTLRRDVLRLRRERDSLGAQSEVLGHVASGRPLPRLLAVLAADLAATAGPDAGLGVAVLLRQDASLHLAADANLDAATRSALADVPVTPGGPLAGAAAALGVPLDGTFDDGPTHRWARAVPLTADHGTLGVLLVCGPAGTPVPQGLEARLEATAALAALSVLRDRQALAAGQDAVRDGLTGLLNRLGFLAAAREAVAGTDGPHTLLAVDVDRLKVVNDSLGHHRGDEVLRTIASRLRETVRRVDVVARLGSDEFVVLCPGLAPDLALARAEVLAAHLARPTSVGGTTLAVRASIGVASTQDDDTAGRAQGGDEVALLIGRAEDALAAAKRSGRGRVALADAASATAAHERNRLEHDLRALLAPDGDPDRELHLVFQPQLDLRTGAASGVEALLRWDHPDLGAVAPDRFLPVAEEGGLMPDLGDFVLARALRQHADWAAARSPWARSTMWVNVSGSQLDDPGFAGRVADALEGGGAVPLGLEITETVVTAQTMTTTATLEQLRGLGVRLAIDDFGTGFSNLSLLQRTSVDVVKIDRSLVAGLGAAERDTRLVDAVLGLAGALDLEVVAEGVETAEQLRALAGRDCRCVQGYLLGRPRRAADLELLTSGVWPETHAEGTRPDDARPVRTEPDVTGPAGHGSPPTRAASRVMADFDAAAREVLAHLRALTGMGLWTVTRASGADQIVLVADSADSTYTVAEGTALPWESSLCAQMVAGAPTVAPDVDAVPEYATAPNRALLPIGAYIGVPLHDERGELFGSLCAFDPAVAPETVRAVEPVLRLLARLLSTVLAADLERDELERRADRAEAEASIDLLTSIANRRGWTEVLAREEARCARYGHQASVIVVDLDGLKATNDRLGHEAGDELLRTAARILRGQARTGDFVARLGGDEFGVLAVQAGAGGAGAELTRLRAALEEAAVPASAGLAARTPDGTLDDAWRAADAAMYAEKEARRARRA